MSKVYLLRVCAYRLPMETCKVWDYESILFLDLKSAVKAGKKILKEQLTHLWKTDEDSHYYKNLDEYLAPFKENVDYIFEVQESKLENIKNWTMSEEDDYENRKDLTKDPLYVQWRFDYKGNLYERWMCSVVDHQRLAGGGWRTHSGSGGELFMPSDELPEAGTKFALGEFVVPKGRAVSWDNKDRVFIVAGCPDLKRYRENVYMCYYIEDGCFNWGMHDHFHEENLERYTGEVSTAQRWLSDLIAGRISVSEEMDKKIYEGEFNFSDQPSYTQIRVNK